MKSNQRLLLGILANTQLGLFATAICALIISLVVSGGNLNSIPSLGCGIFYLAAMIFGFIEFINRIIFIIWTWSNLESDQSEKIVWTLLIFLFATIAIPLFYWIKVFPRKPTAVNQATSINA